MPMGMRQDDRKRFEKDVADICGRERLDFDIDDLCGRKAIDSDTVDICGRKAIDADIHDAFMNVAPIIAIVPMQMPTEHILRLNDYYVRSIVLSGGVPLIMPIDDDERILRRLLPIADGFVLTGGQDVDPKRYGITPEDPAYLKAQDITPMRDRIETRILEYAYNHDVALLGICRGMQTMNVHFGGTLYLDLKEDFDGVDKMTGKPINHWQTIEPAETTHYLRVVRDSKLGQALGTDISAANSFHHQGVCEVAPNMRVVARSEDGLIEAVEVCDRSFMLGVQWHPEFFLGEKHTLNLFTALIAQAIAGKKGTRLV